MIHTNTYCCLRQIINLVLSLFEFTCQLHLNVVGKIDSHFPIDKLQYSLKLNCYLFSNDRICYERMLAYCAVNIIKNNKCKARTKSSARKTLPILYELFIISGNLFISFLFLYLYGYLNACKTTEYSEIQELSNEKWIICIFYLIRMPFLFRLICS